MTVKEAAKVMGVTEQFIRLGLQQGRFPWGYAVKMKGRFSYYINSRRFMEHEEFDSKDINRHGNGGGDARGVQYGQR